MNLVFVYGTLKRGGSNHGFLRGQKFLDAVRTAPGFTLYSLGDYPGMVRVAGDTMGVNGEIWAVDNACLAELDRLEGIDEGLYSRAQVPLAPNAHASSAQTYFYSRSLDGLAALGDNWPVQRAT